MTENLIQIIIVALSAVAGAVGLVVAGTNIAKSKKKYVERDEHKEAVDRIHTRIDENCSEIKDLKKTTNTLEHEIKGIKEDISEIKHDSKDTKGIMREMNETVLRMSVRFDEYMKVKNKE